MSISWAMLSLDSMGEGRKARKASIMGITWAILSLNRVAEGRKARKAGIMSISWAILSLSLEGQHHEHHLGHPQSEQGGGR